MCVLLNVSSSAYYNWCKRKASSDKIDLIEVQVRKIFNTSKGTYGSPRICSCLNDMGVKISKSTVARIMKSLKIKARPRRKFVHTTDSKHDFKVFENILNRDFYTNRVNTKWVSDITYILVGDKWAYLTVIIDLADRMVVAWNVSDVMTAHSTTVACLRKAMKRRKIMSDLLLHSDRGVQYCCHEFRQLIKTNNWLTQSMSRKGNCWDNAPAESFFKTLKVEWTNKIKYQNINQLRKSIFDYIERWYNTKRKHSTNGYMSPLQKHYFLTRTAA